MLKAIGTNICVKVDKVEDKVGSIYVPDDAKEKKQTGLVITVGDSVAFVKKGDKIIFGKYSGSEVEIDRVTYLIFKEDDVLAVLS